MKDLLARARPTPGEFVLHLFLLIIVTVAIAFIDITFFDTYVLPDIEQNFGDPDQLSVGDDYWRMQLGIILLFGVILGLIRFTMGHLAGSTRLFSLLAISAVWGLGIMALFFFGWIDFLYYALQPEKDIPSNLPWLNEIGIFQVTKFLTGNENVNPIDLYTTMFLGLFLYITLWMIAIHKYKKRSLKVF